MKSEVVRCEFCKMEIESEPCKFAVHSAVIEGKEYVFCCARCAQKSSRNQRVKSTKDSLKAENRGLESIGK